MAEFSRWALLKGAVDAVIDAPSEHLSMLLRRVVGGQHSLYLAVRNLLKNRSAADDFLEPQTSPDAQPPQNASTLSVGTTINGRYRVDRLLGAGGMGEVYECYDQYLDEAAAVKVLRPAAGSDATFIASFRDELTLGRRVQHPNACRLHDLQVCEVDGRSLAFFTMELLAGETLDERLKRGPMDEAEALPIALQITDGIQAIHEAGILHRDLKCSNIILANRPGGERQAVVTDFGLARHLDAPEQTLTAIGRGTLAGTPAYMAPEQLEGRTLSRAADIHALGVILFRMVTARFPFAGQNNLQIAMRRLNGRPVALRSSAPSVSRCWESTVHACLDADPARRPATALEVAQRLRGMRAPRRPTRRIFVASLGAAAVLASAIASSYIRTGTPEPEALRHWQLGQEFVDRRQGDDLRQAIGEFEQALFVQPTFVPAWVGLAEAHSALANWGLVEPREALGRAAEAAKHAVTLDGRDASAQAVLGYTLSIDLDHWREAGRYFRRALEIDNANVKVRLWYAAHLGRLGEHDEAIRQLQFALQRKPADMLLNHQLALEYFRSRRNNEFLAQAEELVRLQPFQANSHLARARALEALGRYRDASTACDDAEKYNLDRGQLVMMRGLIAAAEGRSEEARALASAAEALSQSRPVDLAGLYARLRLFDRSLQQLERGYQIGDSSILTANALPYFDSMRTFPPFVDFLGRLGITRSDTTRD